MNVAVAHKLTQSMRQYLLPLMIETFGDCCAECGEWRKSYEIDHLRYGPKVTMYDLQLVCWSCHKLKSMASGENYLTKVPHCSSCCCYDEALVSA